MLNAIIKAVLSVLIDKFFDLSFSLHKKIAIKRGIRIRAEKNIAHIAEGDDALSQGDLDGWLEQLNKEE